MPCMSLLQLESLSRFTVLLFSLNFRSSSLKFPSHSRAGTNPQRTLRINNMLLMPDLKEKICLFREFTGKNLYVLACARVASPPFLELNLGKIYI